MLSTLGILNTSISSGSFFGFMVLRSKSTLILLIFARFSYVNITFQLHLVIFVLLDAVTQNKIKLYLFCIVFLLSFLL